MSPRRNASRAVGLAAVLALSPLAAGAQTGEPMSATPVVIAHGIDMLDGALSAEQEAVLTSISYQSAVARTCIEFELDLDRFEADFALLDLEGEVSPEQETFHNRALLVSLGVITGGFLAQYAEEPDEFCGEADAFVAESGDDTLFAPR